MNRHLNQDKDVLDVTLTSSSPAPAPAPVQLDTVVTVAIGDSSAEGRLSSFRWQDFQEATQLVLDKYATVVGRATGLGSPSDHDGLEENTAIFIAINPHDVELGLRRDLAQLLRYYGQTSAALSIDPAHQPVFATPDGYRPQVYAYG